jgi:hypothetical protein
LSTAYCAIARSTIGCVHDAPSVVWPRGLSRPFDVVVPADRIALKWRCPVNSLLKKKSRDANHARPAGI